MIAELERLRESDMVRVIDAIAVYKDAGGELETEHLSNLTEQEAIELGSKRKQRNFMPRRRPGRPASSITQ